MEKEKIAMLTTSWKVINYMNDKPSAETEEIMRYVLKESQGSDKEGKIRAIAAANRVIKYKQSLRISDKEIIQKIMNELNDILEDIEKSEMEE